MSNSGITKDLVDLVNEELVAVIENNTRERTIKQAASHLVRSGGKRLRPLLCLLSYRALGGTDLAKVLPLARCIEYIHTWTLIHDDIIDKSDTRRGLPTVHTAFGEDAAIL